MGVRELWELGVELLIFMCPAVKAFIAPGWCPERGASWMGFSGDFYTSQKMTMTTRAYLELFCMWNLASQLKVDFVVTLLHENGQGRVGEEQLPCPRSGAVWQGRCGSCLLWHWAWADEPDKVSSSSFPASVLHLETQCLPALGLRCSQEN